MSEHVTKNTEQEEVTLGMTFMGFLMGTAAISGIYFLPSLIIAVVDIVVKLQIKFNIFKARFGERISLSVCYIWDIVTSKNC